MTTSDSTTNTIYRIVCFATGQVYVGKSTDYKRRRSHHFWKLRRGDHRNKYLQNAYNKYGENAFYFELLETNIPDDEMDNRERYWVAHFNSYENGFNLTIGGGDSDTRGVPCTWNGQPYENIADAARANNITLGGLRKRLAHGYTCDADVIPWGKPVTWNNITYSSKQVAAKAIGVPIATFHRWIKLGFKCDEDTPDTNYECVWEGISYKSAKEAGIANGVHVDTMGLRIRLGYACESDMRGKGSSNRRQCVWNGIVYQSIEDAAKACGITTTGIRYRLRCGYTCDSDIPKKRGGKA